MENVVSRNYYMRLTLCSLYTPPTPMWHILGVTGRVVHCSGGTVILGLLITRGKPSESFSLVDLMLSLWCVHV